MKYSTYKSVYTIVMEEKLTKRGLLEKFNWKEEDYKKFINRFSKKNRDKLSWALRGNQISETLSKKRREGKDKRNNNISNKKIVLPTSNGNITLDEGTYVVLDTSYLLSNNLKSTDLLKLIPYDKLVFCRSVLAQLKYQQLEKGNQKARHINIFIDDNYFKGIKVKTAKVNKSPESFKSCADDEIVLVSKELSKNNNKVIVLTCNRLLSLTCKIEGIDVILLPNPKDYQNSQKEDENKDTDQIQIKILKCPWIKKLKDGRPVIPKYKGVEVLSSTTHKPKDTIRIGKMDYFITDVGDILKSNDTFYRINSTDIVDRNITKLEKFSLIG